jgi:hypothetical protein
MTERLPEISKVLQKYGFDKLFGVARLHRHYLLKETECVLWEKSLEGYVSSVR